MNIFSRLIAVEVKSIAMALVRMQWGTGNAGHYTQSAVRIFVLYSIQWTLCFRLKMEHRRGLAAVARAYFLYIWLCEIPSTQHGISSIRFGFEMLEHQNVSHFAVNIDDWAHWKMKRMVPHFSTTWARLINNNLCAFSIQPFSIPNK